MKIALSGYGKMGKAVEEAALKKGHSIILKINSSNRSGITLSKLKEANVVIDFSRPDAVVKNIHEFLSAGLPVVVGTTGWYAHLEEIKIACMKLNGSMVHASNFSIGVNIFFEVNRHLAGMMNSQPEYKTAIEETHHKQKIDAPSGTAISLAGDILDKISRYKKYLPSEHDNVNENEIPVRSFRTDNAIGIHSVKYHSSIDEIEIRHAAFSREGFALGAVLAAEWIAGKKGFFTMNDVLNINS